MASVAAAEDAVAQLLCVHLGLLDDWDADEGGDDHLGGGVRDFRDLFQLRELRALPAKRALLRAAEASACTGVILDVLLFTSQTMAPHVFRQELAALPISLAQWVAYLVDQCLVTNESVSLSSLRGILDLYAATQRYRDLATMLLSLVFVERQLERSLRVTTEVLEIAKYFRHRFPAWILDVLNEYVELSKLQLETEARDARAAPESQTKDGYMDKRSRNTNNLQANWRMRYFKLSGAELVYFKHDAEHYAKHSRNPFSDKKNKQKGSLRLMKGLTVAPLDYAGKFSIRPHCIKIGDGEDAFILDACTPETQRQWLEALAANIKRFEIDQVWILFPRKSVHRMTVGEFLRYCLLYHGKKKNASSACHPSALQQKFNIDGRRYLYAVLMNCALTRDWKTLETLVQPGGTKLLGVFAPSAPASTSSSATAPTSYSSWTSSGPSSTSSTSSTTTNASSSSTPIDVGSSIGYGAVLDVAIQRNAPESLVATLEMLHQRHDAKRAGAWTCFRDADDSKSLEIPISVPESVRADTNWD